MKKAALLILSFINMSLFAQINTQADSFLKTIQGRLNLAGSKAECGSVVLERGEENAIGGLAYFVTINGRGPIPLYLDSERSEIKMTKNSLKFKSVDMGVFLQARTTTELEIQKNTLGDIELFKMSRVSRSIATGFIIGMKDIDLDCQN